MNRTWSALSTFIGLTLGLTDPAPSQVPPVYHVRLDGTLSDESLELVQRAIEESERSGATGFVLELDVDDDPIELADILASLLAESTVTVHAYVNSRALNAGALLALAAASIHMSPDAILGGTETTSLRAVVARGDTVVQVSSLFGDYAAAHGVDRAVGVAMVDSTVKYPRLQATGGRLVLTSEQAVKLGLAVGAAATLRDLLKQVGLDNSELVTVPGAWRTATVTVDNNNWQDVNVFVCVSGGMCLRLGTVTSMNSATYAVPAHFLSATSDIRLVAEVIGSDEEVETETMQAVPGLMIQWRIENVLRNSTYFVWIRS